MALLKKTALVLVLLVAGVLLFALTKPDRFRVERRISIQAPPEKVAPLVADFHQWGRWSPWEKLEPGMKRSFDGAASGPGAVYAWEGDKVGAGRMEVLQAGPAGVQIQLDFIKPIAGRNTAEFSFTPQAGGTDVLWAMHGPLPYVSKLMTVFVSMDSMIGKDFEQGLAQLKAAAEAR
jgi:hypothetical protein